VYPQPKEWLACKEWFQGGKPFIPGYKINDMPSYCVKWDLKQDLTFHRGGLTNGTITKGEHKMNDKLIITGDSDVEKNPAMCRHYAFLFNTYVFLQIFNEINAKKLLPSENNIFAGLFDNFFFITVLLISMVF